ncbi:hypothetical protein SEVIR_1G016400v4 [Setaria viridis]|uniref:Uncharacterized protein n=2 Tax=Setaria TaxID=4554 RepID=A0A368PFR9_SETIT|nr:hypothetical protein SETIT_1G016300v2 [Setaria italica]TKW36971.1 hypothetical protein SEVIR_1G016400v2 [Setaria viridis]
MKLTVCLCICILLVASSSPVPISDRCPVQCRPPEEDVTAIVVGQAQTSAASMTASFAAADQPPPEVFESSKRLSPGGPNPQHH